MRDAPVRDAGDPPSSRELSRAVGLPALTFFGMGQILGAGIYSVIGAAAEPAGPALWLSFLIAAAVAFLSSLSYAELATAMPEAGAEFVYVGAALPTRPWAATAIGVVIIGAAIATAATVSIAFDGYLRSLVALPPGLAAAAVLVAATVLNFVGIRESTWANILFTLIEVGGLIVVIAVGIGAPGFGDALVTRPDAGVFVGAALVFFAYLGFEDIANLAEESRRPSRDLPRAIFLSLVITTVLYVLVGLAVVALAPAHELAQSRSPLVTALGPDRPYAGRALAAVALFATANTALITLIVTSRMVFGMARAGNAPSVFRRLTPRGTPWAAALLALGLAALLVPFGRVAFVGGLSSLGA
jgi:APA family basic amino acid/polyamine antiporter